MPNVHVKSRGQKNIVANAVFEENTQTYKCPVTTVWINLTSEQC